LLALGTSECHTRYDVNRFPNIAELPLLLTPGEYVDWGMLNLYLNILVFEQGSSIAHIPWDLVTSGIEADFDCEEKVESLFTVSEWNPMHYKLSWVSSS